MSHIYLSFPSSHAESRSFLSLLNHYYHLPTSFLAPSLLFICWFININWAPLCLGLCQVLGIYEQGPALNELRWTGKTGNQAITVLCGVCHGTDVTPEYGKGRTWDGSGKEVRLELGLTELVWIGQEFSPLGLLTVRSNTYFGKFFPLIACHASYFFCMRL